MKHFIGTNTIQGNEASIKTYWLELKAEVEAITQALERDNPNYVLLNQKYTIQDGSTSNQYYHAQHLAETGIIQFGWDVVNKVAVVVFIPSMLRLHRGLIAHDKHTYLYLGKGWGGTTAKLSTLDSSIQLAVKNLCATYDISLEDPSIMVGSFGDGVITRYLLAGYSVICDVLEENENITYDSDARQDWSAYKIAPMAVSAGVYVPDLYINGDATWGWTYVDNGLEYYGRNVWFVFNAPSTRFIYKGNGGGVDYDLNWLPLAQLNSYTIYAWDPLQSSVTPTWNLSGKNNVPWVQQTLIHKTYALIGDTEEEILVEDTVARGKSIFDERTDYTYTLNIKNMGHLPAAVGCNVRFG